MKFTLPFSRRFTLVILLALARNAPLMAQTNKTDGALWLEKSPPVPEFAVPATKAAWTQRRVEIRAALWQLFGKLPPRPKLAVVQTLSRENRGDYFLEKFEFDNGAGATVPGYLLLPKAANASKKAPAILYCHQHGGQYGKGGKEEL
ncbi:MAG: hypothetical protein HY300_17955, partial [Verrucomicrobia bacterium]|nr:hypothetical protein [Verrucomicrobiota bacterium]